MDRFVMQPDDTLRTRLLDRLDAMSPRLRQAARHLVDHPQDIALLSMRELARDAGVSPATMTRLAQFMGEQGFDTLRAGQVAAIRGSETGLLAHVVPLRDAPDGGPEATIAEQLAGLEDLARNLASRGMVAAIIDAARHLESARRIHVLGSRSCHSVAWQFHYVLSLLGRDVAFLDGPAGTGPDLLMRADRRDALLAISVSPYASHSLAVAQYAAECGLTVIALTDSAASPLIRHAALAITCPIRKSGLFHSLVPLMTVSECLCALIAATRPDAALAALRRADAQLAALAAYASPTPLRSRGGKPDTGR